MFAFVLRPAWLTTMILTRRRERSRLAGKLPQSNRPHLSPLSVWVLCFFLSPSCHHSLFQSHNHFSFLLLSVSVFTRWGRCVSGRIGSRIGGGRSAPLWSLGSDRRLSEGWGLESTERRCLGDIQHRPEWPSRVCVCVCVCICVHMRVWTVSECLLMASAVLKDCWLLGAVCLCTKGITFHYMKNRITHSTSNPSLNNGAIGMRCHSWYRCYKYTLGN